MSDQLFQIKFGPDHNDFQVIGKGGADITKHLRVTRVEASIQGCEMAKATLHLDAFCGDFVVAAKLLDVVIDAASAEDLQRRIKYVEEENWRLQKLLGAESQLLAAAERVLIDMAGEIDLCEGDCFMALNDAVAKAKGEVER